MIHNAAEKVAVNVLLKIAVNFFVIKESDKFNSAAIDVINRAVAFWSVEWQKVREITCKKDKKNFNDKEKAEFIIDAVSKDKFFF